MITVYTCISEKSISFESSDNSASMLIFYENLIQNELIILMPLHSAFISQHAMSGKQKQLQIFNSICILKYITELNAIQPHLIEWLHQSIWFKLVYIWRKLVRWSNKFFPDSNFLGRKPLHLTFRNFLPVSLRLTCTAAIAHKKHCYRH